MMVERKYFGTDGIRGLVGQYPVTPEFVLKLGWAIGRVLANKNGHKVLVGKDTRISGYMFEAALEAGLAASGVNIEMLGPMPTPAIAYLTRTLRAQAGIVISASHNPYYDNGFKFFSHEGFKLPDDIELQIEAELNKSMEVVESAHLGKASRIDDAAGRYIEFCKSTIPASASLKGLKLVIDCANGATYYVAPCVFTELGAEVITISAAPDGLNINKDCGSMHLDALKKTVATENADLGIAFDGDGDRVLMLDRQGEIVDGDELLFVIVQHRLAQKQKNIVGVVGTLMSNFGFEQVIADLGLAFVRAKVGDRYVMNELKEKGWALGGENSGHIICLDKTTTGDGIVSALQVLQAVVETGKSLNELKQGMKKYPQVLLNVSVSDQQAIMSNPKIKAAVTDVENKLAGKGRVLLRPSGTEPIVRVMVEGEDASAVSAYAKELVGVVETS